MREVMRAKIVALPASMRIAELTAAIRPSDSGHRGQWLYPVVTSQAEATLVGVLTRRELQKLIAGPDATGDHPLASRLPSRKPPVVAYPDEPLRAVVYRMAESGLTRMPVVERRSEHRDEAKPTLLGLISLNDLLKARTANLESEHTRQRVLSLRVFPPRFSAKSQD